MNWSHVPLGEILAPAPVRRAGNEEYPILSMTMSDGLVLQSDKFKKRVASRDTANYRVVKNGELVVGFPIDEAVLAVQRVSDAGIVSPAYKIWTIDKELADELYLERYLRSEAAIAYYVSNLRSSTARRRVLPDDKFRGMPIPLPSLEQQKRIVAILDKADAIRRKREQTLDLADEFLKSVFLEMFGDPVTNPRGYRQMPLGDIIKVSSGNGLTSKMMDPDGSYPVYGGNGINGYHSKYMFEEPQIVIGRVGVYCGAVHISEPRSWITDNALFVREYKMPINQTYLEWALRFANLNQYAGRAAQPLISGSRIYPIEIVVPEDEEQNRFERVVRKKLALTKKLGAAVEASKDFFGSLSQRAYRGEL